MLTGGAYILVRKDEHLANGETWVGNGLSGFPCRNAESGHSADHKMAVSQISVSHDRKIELGHPLIDWSCIAQFRLSRRAHVLE